MPHLDVAIAGFRGIRNDAEGHEFAGRSLRRADVDRRTKGRSVLDEMIRRHHEEQRVDVVLSAAQRRTGQGGRGIPPDGFEDDGLERFANLPPLLAHKEPMLFIADHQRALQDCDRLRLILHPLQGALEQRNSRIHRQELLRVVPA